MKSLLKFKIVLCLAIMALIGLISFGAKDFQKASELEQMGKNIFCISTEDETKSFFTLSKDTIEINTAMNMESYGRLECFNRDNLELDVNTIVPPQKGEIEWIGTSYVYRPYPEQTGEDSFSFCVSDNNGNISQTGVAKIWIDKSDKPYYIDMNHNPYQYSAVKLSGMGIIDGDNIGGIHLFYPEREVTGGEYVLMLLAVLGKTDVAPCVNTGLKNDSDIPLWIKPYVKKAIDIGIITTKEFYTTALITRAEAVVLTSKAANLPNVERVSMKIFDKNMVPDWSMQAYMNMYVYNMLEIYDGSAYPNIKLKKDYAAGLLMQLKIYIGGEN